MQEDLNALNNYNFEVGEMLVFDDNAFNRRFTIDATIRKSLQIGDIVIVLVALVTPPGITQGTLLAGNPLTLQVVGEYSRERFRRATFSRVSDV